MTQFQVPEEIEGQQVRDPLHCGACGRRHWNACPALWGGIAPEVEIRQVVIPPLGSINEPNFMVEGWRVIRDPDTGYALYLAKVY
jgi:hypothetical protein